MKFYVVLLLLPLLIGLSTHAEAQTTYEKNEELKTCKKKKMAKRLRKNGSYYNAVKYYEDVHEKKPEKSRIVWYLAELNYDLRDYEEAEKYYAKLAELDENGKGYPTAKFYLGKSMKANGKYEEAKAVFSEFSEQYKSKKDGEVWKELAKKEIEGCDYAIEQMENPSIGEVTPMPEGFNEPLQDYGPLPTEKGMLFSRLDSDTAIALDQIKGGSVKDMKVSGYYSKIFSSEESGKSWSDPERLPKGVNDPTIHNGNPALSLDGKTLYFTRCEETKTLDMECKIYSATKTETAWTEAEEVEGINAKKSTTTQPAIGMDENGNEILYFSSNREGGLGGMDIWYATKKSGGGFAEPKNMGKGVNTPQDEVTPFYDPKFGVFYFSSDGHKNIGMLDVFKVEGNVGGEWGEVINLGYPVNSGVDDIYLKLNEEGEVGYMVSNRDGTTSPRGKTCCDDIWNVAVIQPRDLILQGYFTTMKDPEKKPISGVEASLYAIDGNNFEFIDNVITTEEMFYFPLEPGTDYKMNGSKEGYWPSVDNIETPDEILRNDTIFKIFYIEKIIRKVIPVKRVYFAFDKSDVREIYKDRLDSIYLAMTENEEFFLNVTGHTDSKGTESYNQKLSERRAQAAKDYLVETGIDGERIETEGKGELEPIAPNTFPDGRDNPVGRQKNRRVEFKLITDDESIEIEYIDDDPEVIMEK